MNKEELQKILKDHKEWLEDSTKGKKANLRYADLCNADLRNADLRNADLGYADLGYANLKGADLEGADLRNADLSYANLYNADLRSANLRYAVLEGANLRYAVLEGADLFGADLFGADLRSANLYNADLRNTNLSGAYLREVRGLNYVQCAFDGHGRIGRALTLVNLKDHGFNSTKYVFFCGCFMGSKKELFENWIDNEPNEKYNRTRKMAANFCLRAIKEGRDY